MSSQKIGPSFLASRVRSWIGADESSDSILPTTGLVGGCGIGSSLFFGAIVDVVPPIHRSFRGDAQHRTRNLELPGSVLSDRPGMTESFPPAAARALPKPPFTPFDQLGTDFVRLFLLRPMT